MANKDPARVEENTAPDSSKYERSISHDSQGHTRRAQQTVPKESGAAHRNREKTRTLLNVECRRVVAGRRRPHPRHSEALAKVAGVSEHGVSRSLVLVGSEKYSVPR